MQHTAIPATRTRAESIHRIERAQQILAHARRIADDARRDAEQLAYYNEKRLARILIQYARRHEAHVLTAQNVIYAELAYWGFHLHTSSRYAYQLRLEHLGHQFQQLSNDYADAALELRVAGEEQFAFVLGELHRRIMTRAKHLWNARTALVGNPRVSLDTFRMTFC